MFSVIWLLLNIVDLCLNLSDSTFGNMPHSISKTILLGILLAAVSCAESETYNNPVIRADIADPSIILVGDTFYATGSSFDWAPHFPVLQSDDLVNWKEVGQVFVQKPEWTVSDFWAPELLQRNGKFYCYYTSRRESDGISFIGVSISEKPEGPYLDHGPVVTLGTEAIDSFVIEVDGVPFISWKAYGLDRRPIELLTAQLSDDGTELVGEPFSLLRDDEGQGMEGQCLLHIGEWYYILYSAGDCCGPGSDYNVRIARSHKYEGPYEKYSGNPILHGNGNIKSCGHGTAVTGKDGRMFYMCHAYLEGDGFYLGRVPALFELAVTEDGWLGVIGGPGAPEKAECPYNHAKQVLPKAFVDDFDSEEIARGWSWNDVFSDVRYALKDGDLLLSGSPVKQGMYSGAVLAVRPSDTRYSVSTDMEFNESDSQGLTFYGDDRNFILWGNVHGLVTLMLFEEEVPSILYSDQYSGHEINLSAEIHDGDKACFSWTGEDGVRHDCPVKDVDLRKLTRWDRTFRPGLITSCSHEQPGIFHNFRYEKK